MMKEFSVEIKEREQKDVRYRHSSISLDCNYDALKYCLHRQLTRFWHRSVFTVLNFLCLCVSGTSSSVRVCLGCVSRWSERTLWCERLTFCPRRCTNSQTIRSRCRSQPPTSAQTARWDTLTFTCNHSANAFIQSSARTRRIFVIRTDNTET